MLDISKYYDILQHERILLSHNGAIDGDLIDLLVQLADKRLAKSKVKNKIRKKVVNILVECLQNSFHYSVDNEEHTAVVESPFLVIQQNSENFTIFTGNYVTKAQADYLKKKLEDISRMTEAELNETYIKALNKEELPTHGGAGVGLIDIARRAKNQIHYKFTESDNGLYLFSMQIEVKDQEPQNKESETKANPNFNHVVTMQHPSVQVTEQVDPDKSNLNLNNEIS
ncbi:MAG: SiaB family protein kinase [Microscillaceae bacterium]|nr:SiaB family protein kinase [Microscillaceae bacterium]MDW8461742.1 SiaB family protein kinase [Cytophagales bacterium]